RQELRKFCKIDVVAILLLERAPVELVERCRQLLTVSAPVADPAIHIQALRIAGEGELKNMQQVEAFLVVLARIAIERADVEQQLELDAEQEREIGEAEKEAAGPGHTAFDRSSAAVIFDLFRHENFTLRERAVVERGGRSEIRAGNDGACHLLDDGRDGL